MSSKEMGLTAIRGINQGGYLQYGRKGFCKKKHQVRIDLKGIKQLFLPILVRCELKYIHALFSK